jgi:hypothetical protein
MTDEPLALGAPMSINVDHVTKDVVLTWYKSDSSLGRKAVARIEPKDLLEVISNLTREGMYALRDVATAIAWGDCDRCGNVRLITVPGIVEGSTTQVRCPACSTGDLLPEGVPVAFADWPRYRKPAEVPVDPPHWCRLCQAWVTTDENGHHTVVHSDPNWKGQ